MTRQLAMDWTPAQLEAAAGAVGEAAAFAVRMVDSATRDGNGWLAGYEAGRNQAWILEAGLLARQAARYAHEAERLRAARRSVRRVAVEVVP